MAPGQFEKSTITPAPSKQTFRDRRLVGRSQKCSLICATQTEEGDSFRLHLILAEGQGFSGPNPSANLWLGAVATNADY